MMKTIPMEHSIILLGSFFSLVGKFCSSVSGYKSHAGPLILLAEGYAPTINDLLSTQSIHHYSRLHQAQTNSNLMYDRSDLFRSS